MKKKYMILGCAAALLIASTSIGGAWSYFTDHTEAQGVQQIALGDVTEIDEDIDYTNWTKVVTISNDEDSQPVYVRVRAMAGEKYGQLGYAGSNWTTTPDTEGYVYYTKELAGGADTSKDPLNVSLPDREKLAVDEAFNVVVVYESTPVYYNEAGEPVGYQNANWDETVTVVHTYRGGE